MPSSCRSWSLVVATAALLAGCSSSPAVPQACGSSAECSASSRCVSRSCVANAPPTARLALPAGTLEANVLLAFDGSASTDPDPGDSLASHTWTFTALDAPCQPPIVAGSGPVAQVRFACAGTYAVALTVADQLGALGTGTRQFTVGPYSGPALLTLGQDVTVDHTCTTGPTHCSPIGPVVLAASLTDAAPAGLSLLWTVEPPAGLPLDANRRVAFDPGPDAPSPTVSIETDGQAISGDWLFRVEARDAAGVAAWGVIRVSVGNHPPVLAKTLPPFAHGFDGAEFTVFAEVPFSVTDPDGDPLVGPAVEWHHVGDGTNATFTGAVLDAPHRVTLSVVVPYAAPEDALHLIGGSTLERSIRFSVSDVNGAAVTEVWPVVVENRPPTLVAEPSALAVDHFYDPDALAYRAIAPLSTWTDPDGDPLFQVPGSATLDPQCPRIDVVNGIARVSCSLPFTGTPAVANFAGTHVVAQHITDPWVEAAATSTVSFAILNRPPAIDTTPATLHTACSTGDCCRTQRDPETGLVDCVAWTETWPAATSPITGRWKDADGDPLAVTMTGAPSQVCTPATCALTFSYGGSDYCGLPTTPTPVVTTATTAGDGATTASASLDVNVLCP